jgi:hypothetical protein
MKRSGARKRMAKEEPTRVQLVIEEDSYDEDCGTFEVEEEPWFH